MLLFPSGRKQSPELSVWLMVKGWCCFIIGIVAAPESIAVSVINCDSTITAPLLRPTPDRTSASRRTASAPNVIFN